MRLPARFLFSARPDPPPALRYAAGILLAAAAQLARLPLHPPTSMSSITYVPFMVLAAAYGGFGPGLVASTLCVMESLFFAIEPVGSLRVADPRHWEGLTALMFTGLVVSLLFEQVRKARHADRSARELKTLLEQTYEAVFVWELDGGRITFWNRAAERMYGFSAAWVLGRSSHGLLATVFPVGAQNYAAAIEASGCWEGELIHTCRDGRQIVVESRMAAHRSNDGRLRVIEITRDISERKRLETVQARLAQEREERELTLQFIIQHSPACLALLRGPDFVFESVNPAYAALCPGEPIVGRTVAEVWPEAAPIVLPLLTTVREAGTVYHATEARIPRRPSAGEAAEIRYFDFSYVPLPAPDGDVRVLVAAVEVTRHKHSEEQLRAANGELAAIYASAPVALMVLDDQLRVRKINGMATRFSTSSESEGQAIGEAIGCLHSLADPRGCGHGPSCPNCPIRCSALNCLQQGTSYENLEAWVPLFAPDGLQRRCLLVSASPLHFNGSRRVLVCAHDITERKTAEEALHQSILDLESALSQKTVLLKEVHHRVKNNLAVISSLLGMKACASGSPEAAAALEESRRRVLSIALIHEHLYGSEHLDRVNFLEYTRQLVQQLYSAQVPDPDRISLRLDVAPIEMGVHRAVPCALILNELVTNALKHAFPGGRTGEVRISLLDPEPGTLELAIEDNGIGCPSGIVERNTKSLGLKIVAILSRQLEGSIEQHPATLAGTRFVLRFPAGSARRAV